MELPSIADSMSTQPPRPAKRKLLDQTRNLLRARHYSYATEKGYLGWIRRFILHFNKRHPRDLGPHAIGEFLTYLAVNRQVSPATQNQALNALVFLYREVLNISLEEIPGIEWAQRRERVPVVFSREEVTSHWCTPTFSTQYFRVNLSRILNNSEPLTPSLER